MTYEEIYEATKNDLPKGVAVETHGKYFLSFTYLDYAGDKTEIALTVPSGAIMTTEESNNGTDWTPAVLMFLWRISRMAQDKPW